MVDNLNQHPNPRVYWLIVRWMAILSAVLFVAGAAYGVATDLTEGQRETLHEGLWATGWVWMLYVSLSQGVSALETFVGRQGS